MRIALVAPLFESVPPQGYGGTERVVHWLAEELVLRGHDVTLFASGDSRTSARLVPSCASNLRGGGLLVEANALHAAAVLDALRSSPAFDVIHAHVDWPGVVLAQASRGPVLTTLHGRLDVTEALTTLAACPDAPVVSISEAQRIPVPDANWVATVHHGLPLLGVPYFPDPEEYVAFVGRISRDKRPDLAIRAAIEAGVKLKIAAKLHGCAADTEYWTTEIEPLVKSCPELIEFVGEIGEADKPEFMGRAKALLFPIDWPEPFGLVAIEAMSFGTPVIARPFGAIPEIVESGKTGFLVDTLAEMVAAIRAVGTLLRSDAREAVRERFSVERMVDEYEALFETAASGSFRRADAPESRSAP